MDSHAGHERTDQLPADCDSIFSQLHNHFTRTDEGHFSVPEIDAGHGFFLRSRNSADGSVGL